jgi:hypothetical protein
MVVAWRPDHGHALVVAAGHALLGSSSQTRNRPQISSFFMTSLITIAQLGALTKNGSINGLFVAPATTAILPCRDLAMFHPRSKKGRCPQNRAPLLAPGSHPTTPRTNRRTDLVWVSSQELEAYNPALRYGHARGGLPPAFCRARTSFALRLGPAIAAFWRTANRLSVACRPLPAVLTCYPDRRASEHPSSPVREMPAA